MQSPKLVHLILLWPGVEFPLTSPLSLMEGESCIICMKDVPVFCCTIMHHSKVSTTQIWTAFPFIEQPSPPPLPPDRRHYSFLPSLCRLPIISSSPLLLDFSKNRIASHEILDLISSVCIVLCYFSTAGDAFMLKSDEEKTKGVNLVSWWGGGHGNIGCRQKAN